MGSLRNRKKGRFWALLQKVKRAVFGLFGKILMFRRLFPKVPFLALFDDFSGFWRILGFRAKFVPNWFYFNTDSFLLRKRICERREFHRKQGLIK